MTKQGSFVLFFGLLGHDDDARARLVAQIHPGTIRRGADGDILAAAAQADLGHITEEFTLRPKVLDDPFGFGGVDIAVLASSHIHRIAAAAEALGVDAGGALAVTTDLLAFARVTSEAMLRVLGNQQ